MDVWQHKLRKLRKKLKGWINNVVGVYRKQKHELLSKIDILDKECEIFGLTLENREYKNFLEEQLSKILKEEEIKWFQRSKEKELLEGDSNTKFYHTKANGRRRKNFIFALHQDEGLIEGNDQLMKYITDFYKKTVWSFCFHFV